MLNYIPNHFMLNYRIKNLKLKHPDKRVFIIKKIFNTIHFELYI